MTAMNDSVWQNPFAKDRLEDWKVEEFPDNYKELVSCFAPPGFMSKLEDPSITKTLIIMGGRGSGKSHILRMLSIQSVINDLRRRLNKKQLVTKDYDKGYFGIYIKSDCFFPLSTDNISFLSVDELNPLFEHLFNLQIGRAVLDATRFFSNSFADIPNETERIICHKLSRTTSLLKGRSFPQIFNSLDNQIGEIQTFVKLFPYEKDFSRFAKKLSFTTAPDFIMDLFSAIRNKIDILSHVVLFILIDEYEDLDTYQQKLINRFIKQRRLIFRIASKIKGIKTLDKIDEVHDYEIIPLHFDVSRENRKPYKRLVKDIFINRLNLYNDVYKVTDPERLLPSPTLEEEGLTEHEIQSELKHIRNELKKKKEITDPDAYWNNFEGHYREAAIYRVLRQKGRDKLHAGFDEYVGLSSGVIRLFIWLCREVFSLAHQSRLGFAEGNPINVLIQSKAATEVSKKELTITIPQNVSNQYGQKMGRFIFDIGSILRAKLYFSTQPQANRIEIIDSEKLEYPEYKILRELIQSGLDLPVFLSEMSFKPRDMKYPMPESFSLNWIFSPLLGVPLEKRWRTELKAEELKELCSTVSRQETLERIIGQIEERKRFVRGKKGVLTQPVLALYEKKSCLNLSNCPVTGGGCNQNLVEYSLSEIQVKGFLAAPFDPKSWVKDPRTWIKESMHEGFKIRCVDLDDISNVSGGRILCKICSCVRQMPIGLFEITELNPNVMFELGMSTALNETPWTEVQGFFRATRLRRIPYASLRAPFIPRFKSLGFSGRFYKLNFFLVYKEKIPSDYKGNFPPPPLEGIEYVPYQLSPSNIRRTIQEKIMPTIETAEKDQQKYCWVLRGRCPSCQGSASEDQVFIALPLNRNREFFGSVEKLVRKLISKKHRIITHDPPRTLAELCQLCRSISASSFCIIDTTYNDLSMLFALGITFGKDKKFIHLHNTSLGPERPISDLRRWAIEYGNVQELKILLKPEIEKRLGGKT